MCCLGGYKSCTSAITSVRLVDSEEPTLRVAAEDVLGRKAILQRIKELNEEIRQSAPLIQFDST